jgi:hypothetical protein
MTPDVLTALSGLERIIINLSEGLRMYAKKDNASEIFVQKQNELILELTNLYNRLAGLKYLEIWEDIEIRMNQLESLDPELSAHTIVLHTKPSNNCNYSFIEINPFKSC